MKELALVLFIALILSIASEADDYTEIHGKGAPYSQGELIIGNRRAARIARDFERRHFRAMAEHSDTALRTILKVGILNLRRRGYKEEANALREGFERFDGEISRIVDKRNRDIGDFEPLIKWLATAYNVLESKLGYQLCYNLRLSDIKSLNYGLPEVFNPCLHNELEFEKHFIHDSKYRGVAPVVTYWVTVAGCSIGTYAAGIIFPICSPIGMVTEWVMDRKLAPYLAPKIYSWACN